MGPPSKQNVSAKTRIVERNMPTIWSWKQCGQWRLKQYLVCSHVFCFRDEFHREEGNAFLTHADQGIPPFSPQLTYLPPPWGECRSSDYSLDFFPVYSITACRIDCETRYVVENCNCRMVHMPGTSLEVVWCGAEGKCLTWIQEVVYSILDLTNWVAVKLLRASSM